jgi:GMP synthase PP-ATPase subunit
MFLQVRSVGVMGNARRYVYLVALCTAGLGADIVSDPGIMMN